MEHCFQKYAKILNPKFSINGDQGPHLRTLNPGFYPGFTHRICYIKGGVNPGLNPGFGVLRFGLRFQNILVGVFMNLVCNFQNKF
jgi:hypothetical protein